MKEFSSILKRTGSLAFRARVCLFLINKLQVVVVTLIFLVKYWITVSSSEKVIVCFPMSVLRENIIHLTVIFFSDIVRYKCKGYTY